MLQEIAVGDSGRVVFVSNMDPDMGIPSLDEHSVDLTVTSPPYWNFVDYGNDSGVECEENYEMYLNSLETVFNAVWRTTKPGGRMAINITNMQSRNEDGEPFVYPLVWNVTERACRAGFTFFDEIIWIKGGANLGNLGGRMLFGSYPYPPTPKILNTIFENIIIFTKNGTRSKVSSVTKENSRIEKTIGCGTPMEYGMTFELRRTHTIRPRSRWSWRHV